MLRGYRGRECSGVVGDRPKGGTMDGIASYGIWKCPLAAIRAPGSGLSVWCPEESLTWACCHGA